MWHWLHQEGFGKDLVVIGLQEVEMGGTSVALAVAKDALSYKLQERGNANAQFWSSFVLDALSEKHFHQVALRQLSGMLIMVFARNNLRGHIGEIATASVACGVLGVGGNKGAVAVQFTLYRQKIALVCSHFAAHQGAVEARNANYCAIARGLTFNRRAWFSEDELETTTVTGTPGGAPNTSLFSSDSKTRLPSATTELSLAESDKFFDAESSLRHSDGEGDSASDEEMLEASTPLGPPGAAEELLQGEGLRSAAAVVWVGDFNYRIEGDYDFVRKVIDSRDLHSLLECDQLQNAMKAGKVFSGMREPPITFPPTYKFDKGSTKYDSSEKRRVPSWCDRILFRGSVPFQTPFVSDNAQYTNAFGFFLSHAASM